MTARLILVSREFNDVDDLPQLSEMPPKKDWKWFVTWSYENPKEKEDRLYQSFLSLQEIIRRGENEDNQAI